MTLGLSLKLLPDRCAITHKSEKVIDMKRNHAKERLENKPPIGMLPDGTLNIVKRGAPRFVPRIMDNDEAASKEAAKKSVPVSPKT
jgi:hypothetical protein